MGTSSVRWELLILLAKAGVYVPTYLRRVEQARYQAPFVADKHQPFIILHTRRQGATFPPALAAELDVWLLARGLSLQF